MEEKLLSFLFLVLALSFWEVELEYEVQFKQDYENIYKSSTVDIKNITGGPLTPDQVKYYLFTKENLTHGVEINASSSEKLFENNSYIVFFIHGWVESRKIQWYEDLKNAFLKREENFTVLQVDWSTPAYQFYSISAHHVKGVGRMLGTFIANLYEEYGIPLDNLIIVGHSLGAQIAGIAGKKVQRLVDKKIGQITALDPAGPLFSTKPKRERLHKKDAKVVEVIHTNCGTFGFKKSCGTIDFFPNGGSVQPGCEIISINLMTTAVETLTCDHHRSYKYFIEAINNPGEFLATKCKSWLSFKSGRCREHQQVAIGDFGTKEVGNFYLETNGKPPFRKRRKENP